MLLFMLMSALALHDYHCELKARFSQVNGMEVVADYGNFSAEYDAIHNHAAILDMSFRGRFCLTGNDRKRFLNGQVTNDVLKLNPGQGCYAMVVNQKARVVGDAFIHCLDGELLLDCEPGTEENIIQRLEQFIIADDVQVVRVAHLYGLLTIQGPKAGEVVMSTLSLPALPGGDFSSISCQHPACGELYCMRTPRLGKPGLDIFVPLGSLEATMNALVERARAYGGGPAGWLAFETARVEAGIPRHCADMDQSNLAPEADVFERAISYSKGCYIGQEIIARIRAHGHLNRKLNGLRLEGPPDLLPPKGAKLVCGGKEAGYITSAVFSPTLNQNIALGYVRREFEIPDQELTVELPAGTARARVCPLPFI